jgi:hypothetical protein
MGRHLSIRRKRYFAELAADESCGRLSAQLAVRSGWPMFVVGLHNSHSKASCSPRHPGSGDESIHPPTRCRASVSVVQQRVIRSTCVPSTVHHEAMLTACHDTSSFAPCICILRDGTLLGRDTTAHRNIGRLYNAGAYAFRPKGSTVTDV